MSEPAATVDSLVKFSYKKKFSFTNRKSSVDEREPGAKSSASSSSSTTAGESDEEYQPAEAAAPVVTAKPQPKGSARLKKDSTSSSSSESDWASEEEKRRKKPAKKPAQKRAKRPVSSSSSSASSSEEEEEDEEASAKRIERQLGQLYKMFPSMEPAHIKQLFARKHYDAKACIDTLLAEVIVETAEQEGAAGTNESIEEWSDGDEAIKARNREAKVRKLAAQIDAEAPASRKRRSEEELGREPSRKKARKLVIASSSDEEAPGEGTAEAGASGGKRSSASSLNSSSDAGKKSAAVKKKAVLSSDEDAGDDYEPEKKAKTKHASDHKKHKKHEKNKKSKSGKSGKSRRRDEEAGAASDQSDGDFAKADASYDSDDSVDDQERLSDDQKEAILALFNDAPTEDIQSMMNISTKRLETLLSLRPFKNYSDLHARLAQKALLPYIDSAKEIIYARAIVSNTLSKCEEISQKMERQVAALIEANNGDNPTKSGAMDIKFQPANLNKNLSLKPYQLIGLNWLCIMHKENLNGILADEMGLGKTCQTIAFLAHLLETNKKMMHLIIVPPSTLDNWVREISTWCPSFYFTVYQGNLEERRRLRFDILNNRFEQPLNGILTTYGLISSTNEDKAFFKKLHLEYCVFDEAHMLKNMNSIRYQSLIQIRSKRKLLLTGTPLQNNLVELMSLLYFVMPNMFHHQTQHINRIFAAKPANVDRDAFYSDKIAQAKGIMRPFMLRRLKNDVLRQLPRKIEEVIFCEMTQKQAKDYAALVNYYKQRKDELELLKAEKARKEADEKAAKAAGSSGALKDECRELYDSISAASASTSTLFKRKTANKAETTEIDSSSNILMELRKAANHPLLRRSLYDTEKIKQMARLIMKESSPDTVYDYVVEDLQVMSDFQIHKICPLYKGLRGFQLDKATILNSGKFVVLDSLLAEKKEMGDRVLLFSQFVIMLDIVEEFLKIKGYKYFRLDGQTAVNERQDMIDCFNNDREIFIFLLSTKAGGVGINLTAALRHVAIERELLMANTVIMHDIDFNPFNDKQAEDRCHRVGQTREVQVYKLISKNTIDETMLKIQKSKLELGADISGQDAQAASKADMVSMLKEALKL